MKVLISWSGEPSHQVALALRQWLPRTIEGVRPYVSSEDIPKGSRWFSELSRLLETTSYGILCLTRDNQHEPWINFEAGALSKRVEESRISPLLIDLGPTDLTGPLALFQATTIDREDIFRLVTSISHAAGSTLTTPELRTRFELEWPQLEKLLSNLSIEGTTARRAGTAEIAQPHELEEAAMKLLILLGEMGGSRIALADLEPASGFSRVRFMHALDKLRDRELLDIFNAIPEGDAASLTPQGRQFLVERGLV